jgi:hypothetical protein
MRWLPAGALISDVSITATAVVFDDTTTAGSPALAEIILNRRAAARDERLYWLTTLKGLLIRHADNPAIRQTPETEWQQIRADTLTSQIGLAATMKAFAEFEALLSVQAGRSPVAGLVRDYLRQANGVAPAERDSKVQFIMNRLEQEYANAVKHSRRSR